MKASKKETPCCTPASSCCGTAKAAMEREDDIRRLVRDGYARVATRDSSCCATASSCCGSGSRADETSKKIGYTVDELGSIPEGANLGLGCGNPIALASLKEGETVLDLGSGAGIDCFLAANKVGVGGRIIGVDMTPEMLERARENARKSGYENVEFRLGEIENLPVADNSVDAVISNCVINLVPNKKRVFTEIFRTLRPGGRIMISDMVLLKELPEAVKNSVDAYIGCLSGAIMKDEYLEGIKAAGFQEVGVVDESSFSLDCMENDPTAQAIAGDLDLPVNEVKEAADSIASIKVQAVKPIDR